MIRRVWKTLVAGTWLVSAVAGAQLQEGRDYVAVQPPQPTNDSERIVVTEFFSYQCPHCFSFHPALDAWVARLPEDALFERVAVSLGRESWAPIAQTFYALDVMDRVDDLDGAIFDAIHLEGARLFDEESIADWLAEHGVDRDEFVAIYDSFSVNSFFARGEQISRVHRIPSIPALVIDGKFLLPIVDNGTFDEQLARADLLIEKARAEKSR
jgi:protein dithiol oxidoreductase (disulfide-forming)